MFSPQLFALLVLAAALGCSSSPSTSSGYSPTTDLSNLCTTPLAPNEPLCSTAFGDTLWSGSHRASYAQGSSPFPGPSDSVATESAHLELPGAGVPVIVSFSASYDDGGRAAWSTVTGADAAIVKFDHETFEIIDWYVPGDREVDPANFTLGLSGAYTAIDSENRFIVGRTRFVSFFVDSVEGDRLSSIELEKRIFMPDEVFCNENDVIAGMSLTYDGQRAEPCLACCRPELMMVLSILPGVAEVLEVVPDSCENSFYAATTIGPDGTVYQGTLNGVSRYVPATSEPLPADERAAVGVEQALDLLDRSQSDAPSNIGERNYLRRAIAQLLETQQVAASAGIADIATAAANAMQSLDEAVAAFDAAEPHDSYVQDARAALSAI